MNIKSERSCSILAATLLFSFHFIFLAALAALAYLGHSLTHLLTFMSLCWIQSLPAFQTKPQPRKYDGGHEETWPNQQKDNDKDKNKDNDNENDKYI